MDRLTDIPNLAIVRALTSGGPYAQGDLISVAFSLPTIGRLVAHGVREAAPRTNGGSEGVLPETISVCVTHPAGPYASDDVLTLSFLDPTIARIHPSARASFHTPRAIVDVPPKHSAVPAPPAPMPASPIASTVPKPAEAIGSRGGVRFTLSWSEERVRRIVQVTDKLFTVDRLGWYRHAFALRLLIPDAISCDDAQAEETASLHLRALRSAALETLGRPLIAAFMPTFSVTPEWLDSLDSSEAAKALSALRGAIVSHATDDASPRIPADATSTCGVVLASELEATPLTSVDAMLPLLIANVSAYDDVTQRLTDYRQALVELFGATAQTPETVRLTQMAQPNHTLDDRLWQLVGTVSERFGGLAVA